MSLNTMRRTLSINDFDNDDSYGSYSSLPNASNGHMLPIRKKAFYNVKTIPISIVEIILLTLFLVFVFIPFGDDVSKIYSSYNIKILAYMIFYFLLIGINRVLHYFHRKARKRGYLDLYRSVRVIIKFPVYLWSFGLILLCGILILLPDDDHHKYGLFYSINFIQFVVLVEYISVLIYCIWYIIIIRRHNKAKKPPDSTTSPNDFTLPSRSRARIQTTEVIEKQAELIRYLQDKEKNLSKKMLSMSENADYYGGDLKYIIDTKDNEIRVLQSENEKLSEAVKKYDAEYEKNFKKLEDKFNELKLKKDNCENTILTLQHRNNVLLLMYEAERLGYDEVELKLEKLQQIYNQKNH